MALGRRSAGRPGRRALLGVLAASLAGAVLLGSTDGSTGTSALTAGLVPACAENPRVVDLTPPTVPVDAAAVLGRVQAAAAAEGGSVAVVVLDAEGRRLVAGPDAQRPLLSASLVKLLIVAELLARAPSPDDLALMERASTSSDDAAMSGLWWRHDGPALVAAAAGRLGLRDTSAPAVPGQWGEAVTSAGDVATLLSRLGEAYGVGVAATLTGWLRATTPVAADGFDQRFGLLSGTAGVAGPVAAKQGWMCCVDGRRQLHSAGLLADGRTVVLLGDFPTAVPWAAAVRALDAAAAAVVGGTAYRPRPAGP